MNMQIQLELHQKQTSMYFTCIKFPLEVGGKLIFAKDLAYVRRLLGVSCTRAHFRLLLSCLLYSWGNKGAQGHPVS